MKIKDRYTNEVIFQTVTRTKKACVELAIENNTYLKGADLKGIS